MVKWGGLILVAVLAVSWWPSGLGTRGWQSGGGWFVFLSGGCVGVGTAGHSAASDPLMNVGWYSLRFKRFSMEQMSWRPQYRALSGGYREVVVPLWIHALASLMLSGFAWRLDTLATRRAKLGACPACSYSRTGLAPSDPCPECGRPAPTPS